MYNRFIWLFGSFIIFLLSLMSSPAVFAENGCQSKIWGSEKPRKSQKQDLAWQRPDWQQPQQTLPVWGFYAHQQINRLAVFTLPIEMMPFFKKHIGFLTDNAVNPDRRRYAVVGEAPRHFIDLDAYIDTSAVTLPRFYKDAVERYGEDTLALHGLVPWQIQLTKYQLTEDAKNHFDRQGYWYVHIGHIHLFDAAGILRSGLVNKR